jgi:hypothetical protein
MKLRYTILILVSFIAGCLQGTLDLSVQTTWQVPVVIALSVFIVYLGSYPKKQKAVARAVSAPLKSLFPNSTQFEKLISKDLLETFDAPKNKSEKGPEVNAVQARNTDPSNSNIENEL